MDEKSLMSKCLSVNMKSLNFRYWDSRMNKFVHFNLRNDFNQIPEDIPNEAIQMGTGVLDMNDDEIFEGDFLLTKNFKIRWEVVWEETQFVLFSKDLEPLPLFQVLSRHYKISGNIYECPQES